MNTKIHEKIEFTNVRHVVEWAAKTNGHKYAYSFRSNAHRDEVTHITFRQFATDVRALASELLSRGCAGKHCVLIGKLSYEWALTYFAVLSIGGVLVPLDHDWSAEDLADTAQKSDASFLFLDKDLEEKADVITKGLSLLCPPVYLKSETQGETIASLMASGQKKFEVNPNAYFKAPINPMQLALLVFTSGTTGKGKGVMLSQNAILSDVYNAAPYIDFTNKTIGILPPHHTYGSTILLLGHVMIGCEVYISSGTRYIVKELKEQKPGHLVLVPLYLETFYRRIIAGLKEQGKYEFAMHAIKSSNAMRKVGIDQRERLFAAIRAVFGGNLKMLVSGGAPINPEIVHFFESIGISVLNGYGITECAPLISCNRSRNVVDGSVGNAIDMDLIKIDDPNSDGEGEIMVKGPNIMLGYYKDDIATAAAFKEGYFRTGDYGKLDKNGILYITGRKKNLIILSNGKNVYPEEIENELASIPGILDIVVYEGQSKRGISYNAIVAEVYPDMDYCHANHIEDPETYLKPFIDDYNKHAVPYKKINILKVREEEFPKNTLRKIMRFKLDTTID